MRPLCLFRVLLSAAAFLPALVAIELSTSVASQASSELDEILRAARIDFAPLSTDQAKGTAISLITDAQKARIAIAQHVITSTPLTDIGSTLTRAKDLQDQLMHRVQLHVSKQLDQSKGVEAVEWELHRGFKLGVVDGEDKLSTKQVLQPEKFQDAQEALAADAKFKERMAYALKRIRGGLRDMNPIAAWRRWRIRRLLRKLSTQPTSAPTPPISPGVLPSPSDSVPSNLPQLRARLSAITALKSTQSQFAAADAHDASAAALIDNAPVIQSDVVLDTPLTKPEPQKMQYRVINYKDLPGVDGGRAPRSWTRAYNRNQGKHVEDWSKVVIPEIAIAAAAR